MVSLQLTTIVPATSRLPSPPNYALYSTTARKRTAKGPNAITGCFSCPTKACLASSSALGEHETDWKKSEAIPKHVAIIMDGNGRWAKNRMLPVQDGHQAGLQNLTGLIFNCCELGIKTLTTFIFSEDNWRRSKIEVDYLMRAIENNIRSHVKELITRHNIQFFAIGNKSRLPESLQNTISWAEKMSQGNKGMNVVMAVSYSGHDDIVEATKKIATKVELGILRVTDINETMFEQELMTNIVEFPNPDLLIRTSGELRISNFLLWQLAYTELYFADKFFPDFGEDDLREALASYRCRQRRYGERRS
ncbi:(2Z,6Z)-farnesyl diphosphate synthase CPT6, chloroplastic-like isoform X2 [Salvia miltiorrhiza]|uniref:(2Z,6Z)-farnesyl diphosphate synthase CPT6, chloroplastic-like isoform X2 n=1 Tax=Salvia miltiorrhiza TaxID=226208 RepID=UPI0025AD1A98|nr:(2Z,6Z)-farnesyl diphosphate synthase CPT6, chloroplastic-like isoform X2 [Salvia miltiorrhiza]